MDKLYVSFNTTNFPTHMIHYLDLGRITTLFLYISPCNMYVNVNKEYMENLVWIHENLEIIKLSISLSFEFITFSYGLCFKNIKKIICSFLKKNQQHIKLLNQLFFNHISVELLIWFPTIQLAINFVSNFQIENAIQFWIHNIQ
jgi:hypothetical protein